MRSLTAASSSLISSFLSSGSFLSASIFSNVPVIIFTVKVKFIVSNFMLITIAPQVIGLFDLSAACFTLMSLRLLCVMYCIVLV